MAEINNPQLADFCNADGRTIADRMVQVLNRSIAASATYNARSLGTIIEAGGAGNLITDQSEQDGRTRVTGGDVYNLVTLLADFTAFMTQGRRDVLAKWKVNGDR